MTYSCAGGAGVVQLSCDLAAVQMVLPMLASSAVVPHSFLHANSTRYHFIQAQAAAGSCRL
jgi:hypothetical protein